MVRGLGGKCLLVVRAIVLVPFQSRFGFFGPDSGETGHPRPIPVPWKNFSSRTLRASKFSYGTPRSASRPIFFKIGGVPKNHQTPGVPFVLTPQPPSKIGGVPRPFASKRDRCVRRYRNVPFGPILVRWHAEPRNLFRGVGAQLPRCLAGFGTFMVAWLTFGTVCVPNGGTRRSECN